ncbi:serine protease 23-like [Diadema antillarum]|uniref:serine protease 23-like n=1 Tax=Diadema antillarum TaxID=105358 RepID=UPI003A86F79A
MYALSLISFLLHLCVFVSSKSDHGDVSHGTVRNKWKGTGENLTFHHEAWHPIHFPAGRGKVRIFHDEKLGVDDDIDGESPARMAMTCTGECATPSREWNYTTEEVRKLLAFETAADDGEISRTELVPDEKFVSYLNDWLADEQRIAANLADEREKRHERRRRSIIGTNTRFPIDDRKFLAKEPFSSAVKLSTGCSGVLIGENYVLTAARCIHDGKRYRVPVRQLNVGFRRGRSLKPEEISTTEWERALIWIRVSKAFLPYDWTRLKSTDNLPLDKDYAVLALKRGPERPYLNVSVGSPVNVEESAQLHMSALDSPNDATLYYRFCALQGETAELLYQQCDGDADAVGAGVYVRRWDGVHGRYTRKVIGVYSGEQSYELDGQPAVNNIATRITPLKFAQICYWLTGDYNECNG